MDEKRRAKAQNLFVLLKTLADTLTDGVVGPGCCAICGQKVDPNTFEDDVSRKEFSISRMCQECQNTTFKNITGK